MADKVTDYVCVPAVCMKTSGEFWIDCYLSYDREWVLACGKTRFAGHGGRQNVSVVLTPRRMGPQYACPHCGGKHTTTCWSCGMEICFDGDDHSGRVIVCPNCHAEGVFQTERKRNASAGAAGSGQ